MLRRIIVISAVVALSACEQETQSLPFEAGVDTKGTVSARGGTVSHPAGVSVSFPAQSVGSSVEVSISPAPLPTATASSGTAASSAFSIVPEGVHLAEAARLDLKLNPDADRSRAWLASVVGVSNGEVREFGATRVDISTGLVNTTIRQLGTFAIVIPEAAAVHRVEARPAASMLSTPAPALLPGEHTGTLSVDCGTPGDRCTLLRVIATQNLLDQVSEAAVVFPTVSGRFVVTGTSASGSIAASAALRVKLQSEQTAETVQVEALLQPTAATVVTETGSQLVFSNVLHRVSGGTASESASRDEIATLIVPKSGGGGSITIERTFQIRVKGGDTQNATVSLVVPVELNP